MTTATMEPEVEYSAVAYRVVSDDVSLETLYEDAHSCYSDEGEPDPASPEGRGPAPSRSEAEPGARAA